MVLTIGASAIGIFFFISTQKKIITRSERIAHSINIMTRSSHIARTISFVAVVASITIEHSCNAFRPLLIQHAHPMDTAKGNVASSMPLFAETGAASDDDAPSADGGELAGQFYDQLRKRAADANSVGETFGVSTDDDRLSTESQRPTRRDVAASRQDSSSEDELFSVNSRGTNRRFTGASSSLFSEERQSSYTSNLEIERQREFDLAGTFERSIKLQAVVLLVALVYMAYVGLSGGITDGSDRYFGGADDVPDVVTRQYGVMTDDAAEAEDMVRQQQSMIKDMQLDKTEHVEDDISQSARDSQWL